MSKGLRIALRGTMALLVLTGVALIVYALVSGERDRAGGPPPAPGPQASAPAARAAPAVDPGATPDQAPGPAEGAQPQDTIPTPDQAPPGDVETALEGFVSVLRDHERDRDEAIVRGERAVLKETIYDVVRPLVEVMLWPSDGEGVDVQLEKVRVKADRAELDEEQGIVRLFGNVTATGEDYQVWTESVVYRVSDRTLNSDQPVRIQKDKMDTDGTRTPAMVVKGMGLTADLTLRNMAILSQVEARLYEVSDDFLAAELKTSGEEEGAREVVITSDGRMVYEHFASKVGFSDNVLASSGQRELRCSELTIQLTGAGREERLEVRDITASGNVQMRYADQVAVGQKLEWHNVTQTGVLTGEPATLDTPQFSMTGQKLTFYRLNDRFHAEGPGSLTWRAPAEAEGPPPAPAADEDWRLGPLSLSGDMPVEVAWHSSMTYNVVDSLASFTGQVTARQQGSSLECEQLVLHFDPDSGRVRKVEADRQVRIRDELAGEGRDILCDRLAYDPVADTVELMAAEGEQVNVVTGPHSIRSAHVILRNDTRTLECPAAGRLVVTPAPEEQPADDASDEAQPIEVEWRDSMRFQQGRAPVADFHGAVRAHRGDHEMRGESVRAEFDKDLNPLRIVVAENAVVDVMAKERKPDDAEPTASPATADEAALLPGLPALRGDHWRLSSQQVIIEVPERLISAPGAGSLHVLDGDTAEATVVWEENMRLDLAGGVALFEGKANADFPDALLRGEKLRLQFDQDRKLRHMWAEGAVYFVTKAEGAWELESETAEAIFAAGNELRQVIARKDVDVRDQTRTLTAQLLLMFFERDEKADKSALRRAVAEGEVHVAYSEENVEAGGDRLEWDREADTYVLTGDPEAYLRRGRLMGINEKIVLDRVTGRLVMPEGETPVRMTMPLAGE